MAAAGIYWVLVLFELTSCNFTKALGGGGELHFEEYLFFFLNWKLENLFFFYCRKIYIKFTT